MDSRVLPSENRDSVRNFGRLTCTFAIGERAQPAGEIFGRQCLFQIRQAAAALGQQDIKGHPGAGVAHFENLDGGRFGIAEVVRLVHETGLLDAARRGKRRGLGARRGERALPLTVEINSAGEYQPRLAVERAGREQILDFLFGVLFGPGVDAGPRGFGIGGEIQWSQRRPEVVREGALEGWLKGDALLHPESIGGEQLIVACIARLAELGQQRAEGRIVGGIVMQVQDGLHLLGSLTAGAGQRHGERGGDVERRKDQVAIAARQLPVRSGGEGVHRGFNPRIGGL